MVPFYWSYGENDSLHVLNLPAGRNIACALEREGKRHKQWFRTKAVIIIFFILVYQVEYLKLVKI